MSEENTPQSAPSEAPAAPKKPEPPSTLGPIFFTAAGAFMGGLGIFFFGRWWDKRERQKEQARQALAEELAAAECCDCEDCTH